MSNLNLNITDLKVTKLALERYMYGKSLENPIDTRSIQEASSTYTKIVEGIKSIEYEDLIISEYKRIMNSR